MKNGRRGLAAAALTLALGAGVWLGTAMADRSATAPPIVYSGQVLGPSGAPIADSTTNNVSLSLYDGPDSGADTRLCPVVSSTTVATRGGHFSLPLSATCSNVFETAEEVWVHLTVNGTVIAATRASAVPYAVTAERVVARWGSGAITTSGSFCGVTAPMTGDADAGTTGAGYRAARALCAAACGSATAHLCSSEEVLRTEQLGRDMPTGRYAFAVGTGDPGRGTAPGINQQDCVGFATDSAAETSAAWYGGSIPPQHYPGYAYCSAVMPFLCCD